MTGISDERRKAQHVQHNQALSRRIAALHPNYFEGEPDADPDL